VHACDASSPIVFGVNRKRGNQYRFRGTVLALLDSSFGVVAWTWLLNSPLSQVSERTNRTRSVSTVLPGVADGFAPPWSKPIFDARLFNFDGRLFATTKVPRDSQMTVSTVQLTATRRVDGGVERLRAWINQRYSFTTTWARGRNQALFVGRVAEAEEPALLVQPWLGVTASAGAPRFATKKYLCHTRPSDQAYSQGVRLGKRWSCGSHSKGTLLSIEVMEPGSIKTAGPGSSTAELRLLRNDSFGRNALAPGPKEGAHGPRVSSTAHLLPISRVEASGARCEALLGVGHLHRGEGAQNLYDRAVHGKRKRWEGAPFGHGGLPAQPFPFGFLYTHFFYTVEPRAPFRILASSGEFCIGSAQDPADCESIQFISGTTLNPSADMLVLSYGINDCEAKLGSLPLEAVWRILEALPGRWEKCTLVS